MYDFKKELEFLLTNDPPGSRAHKELSVSLGRLNPIPQQDAKEAAVMLILQTNYNASSYELLFIKRATVQGDVHSGQIGFPGGKREKHDVDILTTAIREVYEEIGVQVDKSAILGRLTSLYIPVSKFIVHPFVAIIQGEQKFVLQKEEVAQVIEFPLHDLLLTDIVRKDEERASITIKQAPGFQLNEHFLWGASGMICNELLMMIRESNIQLPMI